MLLELVFYSLAVAALIATVSNLDNLGAGVAFGLRETTMTAVPDGAFQP